MRESNSRIARFTRSSLTLIGIVIVLLTLVVSAGSTLSFEYFEDNIGYIYFFNAGSILVLIATLTLYIIRFWKNLKLKVAGTRLTIGFLRNFAIVILFSLTAVYFFTFFSIRGFISEWVDNQVGRTVFEASQLEELFRASIKERAEQDLKEFVDKLGQTSDIDQIAKLVVDARKSGDFEEVILLSNLGDRTAIIASSSKSLKFESLLPQVQGEQTSETFGELNFEASEQASGVSITNVFVRQGEGDGSVSSSESPSSLLIEELGLVGTQGNSERAADIFDLQDFGPALVMVVPVFKVKLNANHYLQVIKKLSANSVELAEQISSVKVRYDRLVYLRGPIQVNFVLTLTLVMLVVLLFAIWIGIKLTNRLMQPLQVLTKGTQTVAAGNYEHQLPVTGNDDFGLLVASFNDMTKEIKRSQEKIVEQRTYLDFVLKNLSSGVIFVEHDTTVRSINFAAASMLDVNEAELHKQTLDEIISKKNRLSPLLIPIRDGITDNTKQWDDTVEIDNKPGAQFIAYSSSKVDADKKEDISYVVVIEDITRIMQAQRFEAWGEVAKKVAHELGNPVTSMQLAVDRIQQKTKMKLSPEDQKTLMRAYSPFYRQLESLDRIVRSLSSYANLPAELKIGEIDLYTLIDEEMNFHLGGDEKIRIEKKFDRDELIANVDEGMITQAVRNILFNAQHAGRYAENLTVGVETKYIEPDRVSVRFYDDGPGFDPEAIDMAFNLFHSTKSVEGSGIGLSVVKKIIEDHGGEITLSNRLEGGAEIHIMLPTGRPIQKDLKAREPIEQLSET